MMFENFNGMPDKNPTQPSTQVDEHSGRAISGKLQVNGSFSGLNLALTTSSMQRVSTKNRTQDRVFRSEPTLYFDKERIGFGVTCEPLWDNFGNISQTKSNEQDESLILWKIALNLTFVQHASLDVRNNHLFPLFAFQLPERMNVSCVFTAGDSQRLGDLVRPGG